MYTEILRKESSLELFGLIVVETDYLKLVGSMAFLDNTSDLWKCVSEIAQDERLSVYDIELKGAHSLCVVVSKPVTNGTVDSEVTEVAVDSSCVQQGVSSEDCSRLCRRLMIYFRAEGERLGVSDEPEIEVCSPGINRMLRLVSHFASAVGERVKVVPHKNAGSDLRGGLLEGVLSSVNDIGIKLADEQDGDVIELRFDDIKRAYVDYVF